MSFLGIEQVWAGLRPGQGTTNAAGRAGAMPDATLDTSLDTSLDPALDPGLPEIVDVYRPDRRPDRRAVRGAVGGIGAMDTAAAGSRVVCGNPECADRWLRRWKDRRRPIFERNWGCSARCMQAMVEAAVRREWAFVDAREAAAEEGQHRHRVPLGLVLLAQGWITHPQLRHALEVQRRAGSGKIGRWLVQEFGLKEACVTHALSLQWGCSVLPMDGFDPRAMALGVPRILVERLGVLPLKISGRRVLYLAFADEMDAAAAFAMERMSGLNVESGLVDEMQWKDARTRLLASEFVDATVERVANPHAVAQTMAAAVCKLQPKASRLVRVHQFYWMRMWLESGAMCSGTSDGDGGIPATSEDVLDTVCEVGIDQTDSGIRRSSR